MKKGYKDIFEQMGLTPEECYLKQKAEIEMLKTQSTANYRHHEDSKEQVLELIETEMNSWPDGTNQRKQFQSLYDNVEETFDENLNSQNYYYE